VSRLLAVIDANMDAELGALRGAMQSMAADMAAQGVRLAAAESAIAAISDTWLDVNAGPRRPPAPDRRQRPGRRGANAAGVAANAAGVAVQRRRRGRQRRPHRRLEAAMAAMPAGMDEAVMRDLQNQLASVRVAVDTAQAQAAAAEARANGAYDLALQALAASDAQRRRHRRAEPGRPAALAARRRPSAPGPMAPAAPAVDLSGIDRNAGDIANIRDFVILLRRDQVALRDRVTALEASDAATAASVEGLEARVAALEAKPFLDLRLDRPQLPGGPHAGAYDFDVDRVYGLNARRSMGNSYFSTGTADLDGDGTRGNDPGERAQDRADIDEQDGNVVAS
jgi:hypothetical protein